jgi:hypothetical protein
MLPGRAEGRTLIGSIPKAKFVELASGQPNVIDPGIVESMAKLFREQKEAELRAAYASYATASRARTTYRRQRF